MTRRRFLVSSIATTVAATLAAPAFADAPAKNPELRAKVDAAIERGLAFLDQQQKPDGSWSTPDYPALTALCVLAHVKAPGGKHAKDKAVREGLEFVRKSAHADGGIYARGMGNYNTSICLSTFVQAGDAKDKKLIEDARSYLLGGQVKNAAKPEQNGGWGYESGGGKMGRPDLDNTVFALEALRLSQGNREDDKASLMWKAAEDFVTRCQNLPATNQEAWASDDAENKGGFVYLPGESPAGEMTTADGKKALRSYGTMSYSGLLSLLYADVKKDDPRVTAAIDWLRQHFTVDENPGQGAQGLYYYYYVMSKSLTAAGIDELKPANGQPVNWRAALASKLLSVEKPNGSWVSDNPRWMERDPVLVTCYALLALETLADKL